MYRDSEVLKAIFALTEPCCEETSSYEFLEEWHENLTKMPT